MCPPSLYFSLVFSCKMRKKPESGWSISRHEEQAEGEQDRRPASKIILRARTICVYDFACPIIIILPTTMLCPSTCGRLLQAKIRVEHDHCDVLMMTAIYVCVILHLKRHACVIISM
jgi:hypothetical protein